MRLYLLLLCISCILYSCTQNNPTQNLPISESAFQNGDIIFQTSLSSQSKAIQLATNSVYSHVGLVFKKDYQWFVFEAIQPVCITPIEDWIKRGKEGMYVVKRLKDTSLLDKVKTNEMMAFGQPLLGKPYDLYFEWSDDRIYCSELVWKLYDHVGIELCPLEDIKDFDLSHPSVQEKITERYGKTPPEMEKVISPEAIFQSQLLFTVLEI